MEPLNSKQFDKVGEKRIFGLLDTKGCNGVRMAQAGGILAGWGFACSPAKGEVLGVPVIGINPIDQTYADAIAN